MFRKSSVLLAVLLAVSIPLSGCGLIGQVADKAKDLIPGQGSSPGGSNSAIVPAPPRGITGTVSVGPTVAAATVPVPSSGGKIAVTDTSSPIAGLELNIPVNAYPDTKQFKLSYAPIQTHSFGEAFNPVTPLIRVDNGGAYAQEMMEIKVPVKIPADNFVMGFFYDEKTKKLEGMPTLAIDANSITVGTQHFTDFLISMIPNTKLKPDIDSGFRPGIDDWQFTNNGSYIAPGGHCAGQSLTAMWYYCTQPDGKDLTLFGRYDNNGNKPATPGFDDDDSLGYRFASTVQSDLPATWGTKLMKAQRGVSDELAWKMFAYSIQLTGEPQYVGMTADVGGHAMICYRIYKGNLYIADPNYPGNTERWIDYVKANGTFTPYESGLDAAEIKKGNSIKFTKIGYAAKSAMVDWSTIGRHWAELKNKTIGNDKFPAYTINWIDDKAQSHELKDGYVSSVKQIKIKVDINPAGDVGVKVYCDNVRLTLDAQGNYELKPGNNKLGIDIYGKVGGDYEYIDFKYINVTFGALTIDPVSLDGVPNQDYVFTATTDNPPAGAKYEWSLDGAVKQSGTSNSYKASFPAEGVYVISVRLLDGTGKEISSAVATANITTGKPKITIASTEYAGVAGQPVTFTARVENAPPGVHYDWHVAGRTNQSGSSLSFTYTFAAPGFYAVYVSINDSKGDDLASANTRAVVVAPAK